MMKLSEELQARGFIHQSTGEHLGEILDGPVRTIYHGIDPSADSAHAGNMVVWMLLRHLVKAGHQVLFLVGGGTGMIGDPKPDSERVLQDESITDSNVAKIKAQAERLIGGSDSKITFVNNKDWLCAENLITFLRDIGKHFTVNELIKKDAIASRLESDNGISYTEFAYPLLQGFDYLTLYRNFGCTLQVGGSDQWGNIIAGVDLIRRKEQAVVHALTVPLVVDKSTGKKFGKSEGNAVWLDAVKTSPFAFYQFWLNTSDESVIEYLKLFTFLAFEEIGEIERSWQMNPGARLAQRSLAREVTTFVHGSDAAVLVEKTTDILFGDAGSENISAASVGLIKEHAPFMEVASGSVLVDVLVWSQLASSKREARTFIESGAVSIEGEKVEDSAFVFVPTATPYRLLKRGKKSICFLEIV